MAKAKTPSNTPAIDGQQPGVEERAAIDRAKARVVARRVRFSVAATKTATGTFFSPGHTDTNGFSARASDAFGTRSPDFASYMVRRLTQASRPFDDQIADPTTLNAALAFVDGLEPENEMEAMSAATLFATNDLLLSMLLRAKQADTAPMLELTAGIAAKLIRASTGQIEALAKLRRGGEQTVKVEHVHVHSGGQAIVGNVGHGGGGAANLPYQSLEPSREIENFTPLLGVDPAGDVVPMPRDARTEAVQDTRRRKPRSAKGQSQ